MENSPSVNFIISASGLKMTSVIILWCHSTSSTNQFISNLLRYLL